MAFIFLIALSFFIGSYEIAADEVPIFHRTDSLEKLLIALDSNNWKVREAAVAALIDRGPRVVADVTRYTNDRGSTYFSGPLNGHFTAAIFCERDKIFQAVKNQKPFSELDIIHLLGTRSNNLDVQKYWDNLLNRTQLSPEGVSTLIALTEQKQNSDYAANDNIYYIFSILAHHQVAGTQDKIIHFILRSRSSEESMAYKQILLNLYPDDPKTAPYLAEAYLSSPNPEMLKALLKNRNSKLNTPAQNQFIEKAIDAGRKMQDSSSINVFIANDPTYKSSFNEDDLIAKVTATPLDKYVPDEIIATLTILPKISEKGIDKLLEFVKKRKGGFFGVEYLLINRGIEKCVPIFLERKESLLNENLAFLLHAFPHNAKLIEFIVQKGISGKASYRDIFFLDAYIEASHSTDKTLNAQALEAIEKLSHYPEIDFQQEFHKKLPHFSTTLTEDELIEDLDIFSLSVVARDALIGREISEVGIGRILKLVQKNSDLFDSAAAVLAAHKRVEVIPFLLTDLEQYSNGSFPQVVEQKLNMLAPFAEAYPKLQLRIAEQALKEKSASVPMIKVLMTSMYSSDIRIMRTSRDALNALMREPYFRTQQKLESAGYFKVFEQEQNETLPD